MLEIFNDVHHLCTTCYPPRASILVLLVVLSVFGVSEAIAFDLVKVIADTDGTTAIVGVPRDGNMTGSVYVFVKGTGGWRERAKLTASDAKPFDSFGWSVAISGNRAIIGAPGDDFGNT